MNVCSNKTLYDYLKPLNIIDNDLLEKIYNNAEITHADLGEELTHKDLITDENLGKAVSDIIEKPFIMLSKININQTDLLTFPLEFAEENKIVCFKIEANTINIASSKIIKPFLIENIQKKTNLKVKEYYTTKKEIYDALALYKTQLSQIYTLKGKPEADILLEKIIETAYDSKASDIHIEPKEANSLVRFRVDGVMSDILTITKEEHDQIVNKIKVESKLRTDEHLAAQDGKMQLKLPTEELDIRVSIVPVVEGENCVLRLLSSKSRQYGLINLGMQQSDLEKAKKAMSKAYGMIIATGPTGSGKTTTMYSLLKILNTRERTISTIEDPVEYQIEGINQIQVNAKTNLTFAEGLKSILRQDPDIIYVGEVRDYSTASIAINSAMTGHLVLSTLHTNDASTTIPRLIDLEVEPFLISSTINLVIAQRLVRKVCDSCKVSYTVSIKELQQSYDKQISEDLTKKQKEVRLYKGKGCDVCRHSGYQGRIGVFEVLEISDNIRKLITAKAPSNEIVQVAIKEGMTTMYNDGISKVLAGITTIEEVLRATKL